MDTIGARVPLRLAELMARDENRNAAVAAARTLEELTERENAPGRAGRSIPQAPGLVIVVCPPMPTVQGPQAGSGARNLTPALTKGGDNADVSFIRALDSSSPSCRDLSWSSNEMETARDRRHGILL
jgi:hypothetical protein